MSLLYVDVVFMYQAEDYYGTSEYICHFSMSIFYKCKTWYVISVCQYLIYVACGMSFWYVNTLSMYHVVSHYCMSIFYLHTMWYDISVCQYFFSVPNVMSFQSVSIFFYMHVVCHFSVSMFYLHTTRYVISVCLYLIYIPRSMSFPYHCCSADVGVFCSRGSSGPSSLLALTQQSPSN